MNAPKLIFSALLLAGAFTAFGQTGYPIPEIQGDGFSSPLEGEIVFTEGVVTGAFPSLSGFFMQDTLGDGDTLTSDGIFVYYPGAPNLNIGDYVEVTGEVQEYYDWTELGNITNLTILDSNITVTPVLASMPRQAGLALEIFEGMFVEFAQPMVVTDNYNLHRYGEVGVAPLERLQIPTDFVDPNDADPAGTTDQGVDNLVAVYDVQFSNERNQIVLDDAQNGSWQLPIVHLNPADSTLRCGTTIDNLQGCLGYSFGAYRLQPVAPVNFNYAPRPPAPTFDSANVTVAGFNVLNYWTTLDNGSNNARGANTAEEFERQEAKIVAAIIAMDADVTGLMEIEDNGSTAIDTLVYALNAMAGAGTYGRVISGTTGSDPIQCAMVYKTASVTPIDTAWGSNDTIFNPASLAQGFTHNASGEKFSVIANHFQYKGGCDDAIGLDQDQDDGQACWNWRRRLQAFAVLDWIPEVQAHYGDPDVVVLGDFNAYSQEDPIDIFMASDLIKMENTDHSYVFQGEFGSLDHMFVTPELSNQVIGAEVWALNADEPRMADYNTEDINDIGDWYAPNPYRASDHNPIVLGLNLDSTTVINPGVAELDRRAAQSLSARPNPFLERTIIEFEPETSGDYSIVVSDINGRVVKMLANREMAAGHYIFTWNGQNDLNVEVPAGLYFVVVLQGETPLQSTKLMKQ